MPRIPRQLTLPDGDGVFHITNQGNNGIKVFLDEEDWKAFVEIVAAAKKRFSLEIYNWALLTTHFHLLLRILDSLLLSKAMHFIDFRYGLHFRARYKYKGHVWRQRFGSRLVVTNNHLLLCGIYVDLNPWRAGIVNHPEDWRWSSARFYLTGLDDGLTDFNPAITSLADSAGERQAAYKMLLDDWKSLPPIRF